MEKKAEDVAIVLKRLGIEAVVEELPQSTHTAAEAALACKCSVSQIAKSVVFRTAESGRAVLVIASGSNRVDESGLSARVGEAVEKATAKFVYAETGFSIGGVPPVGHLKKIETFIDADLEQFDIVWAAAGTSNALFKVSPADLIRMTGGAVISVAAKK